MRDVEQSACVAFEELDLQLGEISRALAGPNLANVEGEFRARAVGKRQLARTALDDSLADGLKRRAVYEVNNLLPNRRIGNRIETYASAGRRVFYLAHLR